MTDTTQTDTAPLTAGEVGRRLGIKSGMVRRYALTVEAVTGISLEIDQLRGRLYPPPVVELMEATRAHLLANPGSSVEEAMRAVTGQSERPVTPPARVPGTLTPADLERALSEVLAPILSRLEEQGRELEEVKRQNQELLQEVTTLTDTVTRLEVLTHAALPAPPTGEQHQVVQVEAPAPAPAWLVRLSALFGRHTKEIK